MDKRELKKKIEETKSIKEKIVLEGRLIRLLKAELKNENNLLIKQNIKIELYEELKKHKDTLKKASVPTNNPISISEELGLKIKSIANAMDIFKEKHDIISKIKQAGKSTTFSAIFAFGLELGLTSLTSKTLVLPTLASIIPTAAYIGLANILRIPFQKTKFEEALKQYETKDEESKKTYKFIEENVKNNKVYLELLSKQKECHKKDTKLTRREQIEIYEKLIKEEKRLEKEVENIGGKYLFNAEILVREKELSQLYTQHIKAYIRDEEKITTEEYLNVQKKSLILDNEIYNRENHLKETSNETIKNVTISTGIMYATRMLLSTLYPRYGVNNIQDAITPFILSIINSTCNIDEIKNNIKLKEAKYVGQYIDFFNKNKAKEIIKNNQLETSKGAV